MRNKRVWKEKQREKEVWSNNIWVFFVDWKICFPIDTWEGGVILRVVRISHQENLC